MYSRALCWVPLSLVEVVSLVRSLLNRFERSVQPGKWGCWCISLPLFNGMKWCRKFQQALKQKQFIRSSLSQWGHEVSLEVKTQDLSLCFSTLEIAKLSLTFGKCLVFEKTVWLLLKLVSVLKVKWFHLFFLSVVFPKKYLCFFPSGWLNLKRRSLTEQLYLVDTWISQRNLLNSTKKYQLIPTDWLETIKDAFFLVSGKRGEGQPHEQPLSWAADRLPRELHSTTVSQYH